MHPRLQLASYLRAVPHSQSSKLMKKTASSFLVRLTACALAACPLSIQSAQSQEVYSQIVGAMAVSIPETSDVVVTPTFARSAAFRGSVTAVSHSSGAATVTLGSAAFTANEFASGYQLLVEAGTLAGRAFSAPRR